MANKAKKGPWWSRLKDELFSKLCIKYPPVGGGSNGIMGRKAIDMWEPMQLELEQRLLAANAMSHNKRGMVRTDFCRDASLESCQYGCTNRSNSSNVASFIRNSSIHRSSYAAPLSAYPCLLVRLADIRSDSSHTSYIYVVLRKNTIFSLFSYN